MRATHIGFGARGSLFSPRYVFFRRLNAAPHITMASTRHQSSTSVQATPWSQHPLKVSASTNIPSKSNVLGPKTAYIALGSNLGDRVGWIEQACNEMVARGIKITRTSSLWETQPMYVLDQDTFVNGACEVSL
jgi:2-amino-4-hydroxy-6-hydroxymethyldihydropteridine diphosphokinase/dihydropteroate synthase